MKAQALGDTSSLEFMRGRRILEINPDHPIVKDLNVRQHLNIVDQFLITIFLFPLYCLLKLTDDMKLESALKIQWTL